jgi:D-alanine-D-alanine ligase
MAAVDRDGDQSPAPRRGGHLRVVILYDGGAHDWTTADIQSVLEPVNEVGDVLATHGHEVVKVGVQPDLAWLDAVRRAGLVFNLCEGVGGLSHLEYKVASTLELVGVPYTGGSAWTMTICHRKPLLNALLESAGLPVPAWCAPETADVPADFPLPAIVKPAAEDASVGIEQGSVATSLEALTLRVAWLRSQFGEPLVQRYVDGREFNVGFIGDDVLPLSEIDFRSMPDGAWNIVSFDAKWTPGSAEDAGTQPVCPARVSATLRRRIIETARAAWQAVQGQGYGRVDLRVDAHGQPWVLEVNPNPDISSDAGLANMALARDWSYADLVLAIVNAALRQPAVHVPRPVEPVPPALEQIA